MQIAQPTGHPLVRQDHLDQEHPAPGGQGVAGVPQDLASGRVVPVVDHTGEDHRVPTDPPGSEEVRWTELQPVVQSLGHGYEPQHLGPLEECYADARVAPEDQFRQDSDAPAGVHEALVTPQPQGFRYGRVVVPCVASQHPVVADDPAFQLVKEAVPVHNPDPRADYVREAITTQPVIRKVLQRIDFDFITDKRPVVPGGDPAMDARCPHGAIRGGVLHSENCTFCHDCLGDGVALEGGKAHKRRMLRDLLGLKG